MENILLTSSEKTGFNAYVIESKGEKTYVVEGYIATHDRDLVDDIITKSAMQDIYDQADTLSVDLEHEAYKKDEERGYGVTQSRTSLIPVGKIVEKRIDDIGVYVKATINPHLKRFDEVWGSLKDRYLKAFSITFMPPEEGDFTLTQTPQGTTRFLTRLRSVMNVALTGNPVNKSASITSVVTKSMGGLFPEENIMTEDTKPPEGTEPAPVEPPKVEPVTPAPAPAEAEVKAIEAAVKELKAEVAEIKGLIASREPTLPTTVETSYTPEGKALLDEVKAARSEFAEIKAKLTEPVVKALVDAPEAAPIVEKQILQYV